MGYNPKNAKYASEYSIKPNENAVIVEEIKISDEYFNPNFIMEKHMIIDENARNVKSAILNILENKNKIIFNAVNIDPFVSLFDDTINSKQ